MDEQFNQSPTIIEPTHGQIKKGLWQKPFFIIVLILIVIFVTIGFVLKLNNISQDSVTTIPLTEPIEEPVKIEKARIAIDPEFQTVTLGQMFTNEITLDAKEFPLTVVKIVLQYDPLYISLSSFEPGTFYKNSTILAKAIDNTKGTALLTMGSFVPQSSVGTIASFSAIPKTVTTDAPAFISFSTSTTAYVSTKEPETAEKNVLTTFGESAITIVQ